MAKDDFVTEEQLEEQTGKIHDRVDKFAEGLFQIKGGIAVLAIFAVLFVTGFVMYATSMKEDIKEIKKSVTTSKLQSHKVAKHP